MTRVLVNTKKETGDVHRITLSFAKFLDTGEVITAVSTPSITTDYTGATTKDAQGNVVAIVDATPLTLVSGPTLVASNTAVQLLVGAGTPGLSYMVSCIVSCGSGRAETCDMQVTINQRPNLGTVTLTSLPTQYTNLPTSQPATAGILWNNGGVLCIS